MENLCRMLLDRGAAMVGFADLTALPADVREDLPRGLSVAVSLNPRIVASIAAGPTPEYFAEYRRVNELLDSLTAEAAEFLTRQGFHATPRAATVSRVDRASLSTRLPHKTTATRAGLGWIGKCALLVTERFGPAVRLGTVLTDAPLSTGQPIERSRCGECTACVEVCPGRAPSGRHWQAGLPRADFFDAFACHDAAKAVSGRAGLDATICGMCIAACPWTQRYLRKSGA